MVVEKTKEKFSLTRLESVMLIAKIDWKELNSEFNYDVESMCKNKDRPPMMNVLGKICTYIGLPNTDYVMMKCDTYKLNNKFKYETKLDKFIKNDVIDAEMVNLYYKESGWSWKSLATLMSGKYVLHSGTTYFTKQTSSLRREDLENLCYALICKESDICSIDTYANEKVPKRILNDRQIYILNKDTINEISKDIEDICKRIKVPTWFIYSEDKLRVSLEFLEMLHKAVNQVTKKNISIEDLCINYNIINKKRKSSKNKKEIKEKNNMEISKAIQKAIAPNEIKIIDQTMEPGEKTKEKLERRGRIMSNNNNGTKNNNGFMEDIVYKIDRLTDEELDKIEKYIIKSKELRDYKRSLFK